MSADDIEIRRFSQEDPADPVLYQSIRLEALQANPEAFGSTFEVESEKPLSWFSDQLGGSIVLGAFSNAQLIAVACFAAQQNRKRAHKGGPWGMYVLPAARRAEGGRRLVEAICNLARQRVELIQLTVVQDNEPARRLYARLGFLEYGLEKNALKQPVATTTKCLWRKTYWENDRMPLPGTITAIAP